MYNYENNSIYFLKHIKVKHFKKITYAVYRFKFY